MEDTLKKLLYAAVGMAAQANEKFEKTVDELVEKGKVSESEAKKLIDEFLEKGEARKEEFDDRFKTLIEKFGFTKTHEMEELRKRVEELEAKLAEKTKSSSRSKAAASA